MKLSKITVCHGVPIVVKQYGKEAFEFGSSFIIVTIPFEKPFTVANETVNETVNATVSAIANHIP